MARTWRLTVLGLAVAGGTLAWTGMDALTHAGNDWWEQGPAVIAFAGGFAGLWLAFAQLARHFRSEADLLRELHSGAVRLGPAVGDNVSEEVGLLVAAIDARLHAHPPVMLTGSPRTRALASLVDEPLLVVDAGGFIETSNAAAVHLFGVGAETGREARNLFNEAEWVHALDRARAAAGPVALTLHRSIGGELSGRLVALGSTGEVALALTREPVAMISGRMPSAYRPADDEPLVTLPLMAVWAAATTPDLSDGRLVAFGCLRLSGPRVFRTMSLDLIVDPGEPVRPEATDVHGISDAQVRGARSFGESWPDIERMLRGCVLVGMEVEPVLALLRREAEKAGAETAPDYTLLSLPALAAVADGGAPDRALDRLCADFAVEPVTRFGAFCPVHTAAEVAARVIQGLEPRGVATFAVAFAAGGRSAGAVVETGVEGEGRAQSEEQ